MFLKLNIVVKKYVQAKEIILQPETFDLLWNSVY